MFPMTSSKEKEDVNLDQWVEQDKISKLAAKIVQKEQEQKSSHISKARRTSNKQGQ